MLTNWGYTLTAVDKLPDMMSLDEYDTYTGRNDDPERVEAEISSACAAIRNFVGWHLYPAEACKFEVMAFDNRVTRHANDLLIQLPARFVPSITSVKVGGKDKDYYLDHNGLLIVFDVRSIPARAVVSVEYVAGLTDAMMAPIKELIAHRVTHALAVPPGITSEASGGVSVTYNANWINNSRATALAGDNKELLIPYQVKGVF